MATSKYVANNKNAKSKISKSEEFIVDSGSEAEPTTNGGHKAILSTAKATTQPTLKRKSEATQSASKRPKIENSSSSASKQDLPSTSSKPIAPAKRSKAPEVKLRNYATPKPTNVTLAESSSESDESGSEPEEEFPNQNTVKANGVKPNGVPTKQAAAMQSSAEDSDEPEESERNSGEDESEDEPEEGSEDGSEAGSEDNASETDASQPRPSQDASQANKGSSIPSTPKPTTATPPQRTFVPPPGYEPLTAASSAQKELVNFLDPSKLASAEIWHITAPASLDISALKSLSLQSLKRGEPVMKHNGTQYKVVEVDASDRQLLLPNLGSKTYQKAPRKISKTLSIQQAVNLPETSIPDDPNQRGSRAAGVTHIPPVKEARKQPEGLRTRYWPPGFDKDPQHRSIAAKPAKTVQKATQPSSPEVSEKSEEGTSSGSESSSASESESGSDSDSGSDASSGSGKDSASDPKPKPTQQPKNKTSKETQKLHNSSSSSSDDASSSDNSTSSSDEDEEKPPAKRPKSNSTAQTKEPTKVPVKATAKSKKQTSYSTSSGDSSSASPSGTDSDSPAESDDSSPSPKAKKTQTPAKGKTQKIVSGTKGKGTSKGESNRKSGNAT